MRYLRATSSLSFFEWTPKDFEINLKIPSIPPTANVDVNDVSLCKCCKEYITLGLTRLLHNSFLVLHQVNKQGEKVKRNTAGLCLEYISIPNQFDFTDTALNWDKRSANHAPGKGRKRFVADQVLKQKNKAMALTV
ncbi:hypothetical protein CR513_59069, partial [Mucuna pruriens]